MTIDRGREARRVAYGALVALSVWFGGMAVLALIVDPVAVIAFGPVDRISRAVVSADASVIAMGAGFHHRSRRRRRAAATSLRCDKLLIFDLVELSPSNSCALTYRVSTKPK
jgi:hypothetical protein